MLSFTLLWAAVGAVVWRGRPRTEATSEDLLGYSGGLTDMGVSSVEGGGSGRADTITASLMSRDPEAIVEDMEGGGGRVTSQADSQSNRSTRRHEEGRRSGEQASPEAPMERTRRTREPANSRMGPMII